jgi:predicted nucleic acid-binding protein
VILVDTSAWLSLHDEDDRHHAAAAAIWWRLMTERAALCSTAYIRLETWSLLQARFGVEAVRRFDRAHLPVVDWLEVSEARFATAKTLVLESGRRRLSLVDAVSFTAMREEAITTAFAFDQHFREYGFNVL